MLYICIYYEPSSKSIVDAWYENIGYRFFWGALSLYSVLFKSTLNNAKCSGIGFTDSDLQTAGDGLRGRSLSLRLQPCWGAT